MSRPVILYESLAVPAAAVGPPLVPALTVANRELLKAPERMKVDHIVMNLEGIENGGIVNPQDILLRITDKNRTGWHEPRVPLENYHNMVRERVEANMWGPWQTVAIAAGQSWVVPAGKWMIVSPVAGGGQVQMQSPAAAWVGVGDASGVVHSDGVNVQIANGTQDEVLIPYRRVNSFESGVWWMADQFRLEKTHSISLNIFNRMQVETHFFVTFQVKGDQTRRNYLLVQEVQLAPGARSPFAGTDMSVTFEEAVWVQQMSFAPYPGAAFDAQFVDMQIEPSQGGAWSEEFIPLIGYANLRGPWVNVLHQPVQDVILDVNEFLRFEFENFATAERTVQLIIMGHTYAGKE